jgi:hypothetical protein
MLNPNVDELLALMNKYKIQIDNVWTDDTVYLSRYGIVIPYSQTELCTRPPKQVIRSIMLKVIQHPDYKKKTEEYVKGLKPKPPIIVVVETIEDKKKLIRERLIKDGIL